MWPGARFFLCGRVSTGLKSIFWHGWRASGSTLVENDNRDVGEDLVLFFTWGLDWRAQHSDEASAGRGVA